MEASDNADPGGARHDRVRIGDAEREQVLSALQEHLAAGRLTVEEYEQRTEQAIGARYAEDLVHLTADLPPTEEERDRRRAERPPWQRWQGRLPIPVPLMIGLAVLAVIALPGPPFLLFPLLWVAVFFAFARCRDGGRSRWDREWHATAPRREHHQVV